MTIQELHHRLSGEIHHPGTPGYDEACTLFNAMIDRRPRLVVRCSSPDDVADALAYARAHDLPSPCAPAGTPSPASRWSTTGS